MVSRNAGFHDDEPDNKVVKIELELDTSQAKLLDNFTLVIGNRDLEYTLDQINSNGSSMHFELLSSKTNPHEHR